VTAQWPLHTDDCGACGDTMSFADLESGTSRTSNSSSATPQSPQDAAFLGLNSSLSLQAFKINQNVQGILRQVDKLGTSSDTGAIRKELYATTFVCQLLL
jgi:hypothetical protein